MSVPTILILTEAGYNDANGAYIKGSDINGFSAWYNDFCRIERQEVGGNAIWAIRIISNGEQIYATTFGPPFLWPPANTVPDSPVGLTFQVANPPGASPVPVVAAGGGSSPQQRRNIYLRKQIKLGNKRGATLK